jgi:hypothetical protein
MAFAPIPNGGDGETRPGELSVGITGPSAIMHTLVDMVGNEETGF